MKRCRSGVLPSGLPILGDREVRQSVQRGMPGQERWYGCDIHVTDKDRMHTVLLV